jgi:hypothetical protein
MDIGLGAIKHLEWPLTISRNYCEIHALLKCLGSSQRESIRRYCLFPEHFFRLVLRFPVNAG